MSDADSGNDSAYTTATDSQPREHDSDAVHAYNELEEHSDGSQRSKQPDVTRSTSCAQAKVSSHATLERYCDLLSSEANALVQRPHQRDSSLRSSMIGASYWTQTEKETFFDSLTVYGPTNLQAVAAAISTKTAPEVRQYLLMLEESVEQLNQGTISGAGSKPLQVPAAGEISEECDDLVDTVAQQLETKLHERMCAANKAKYGDDWIIDLAYAEAIEERLTDGLTQEELKQDGQRSDNLETTLAHDDPFRTAFPSASLLRPLSFMETARNVFMNSNINEADRYDQLPITTKGSEGPSILRSAFEDTHDLCISYTKRLVYAAHFQAMTRLRAEPDPRRLPTVKAADVHKALDIMKIERPNTAKYWADAVLHNRLKVYSESDRYQDGRHHARRLGFELEDEEIKKELFKVVADIKKPADDLKMESEDDSQEQFEHSDIDSAQDEDSQQVSMPTEDDSEEEKDQSLESYDQIHNREVDNSLRELLDLPKQPRLRTELNRPPDDLENATHHQAWRRFDTYIADWEQPDGVPPAHAFQAVDADRSSKRRRLMSSDLG